MEIDQFIYHMWGQSLGHTQVKSHQTINFKYVLLLRQFFLNTCLCFVLFFKKESQGYKHI